MSPVGLTPLGLVCAAPGKSMAVTDCALADAAISPHKPAAIATHVFRLMTLLPFYCRARLRRCNRAVCAVVEVTRRWGVKCVMRAEDTSDPAAVSGLLRAWGKGDVSA